MTRAFSDCSRTEAMRALRPVFLLATFIAAGSLSADSAGCNRARAIVDEVAAMVTGASVDHHAVLGKLRTAQQLCPTLGDAWKYAHCSALALGDAQSARMYKDRAIFNGVADVSCSAFAGVVEPPPPLPSRVHQKYALVVGISEFSDPAITALNYAAKDAKDFAEVLADPHVGNFPPANVTLLTNDKATRRAILSALQNLFEAAREDDLVVVFISSHGLGRDPDKGLPGMGYIATHDMSLAKVYVDAIGYYDLTEQFRTLRARRKVFFLDTCFSGEASKRGSKALSIEGGGIDAAVATRFLSGEGSYVISSSSDKELSWESDALHNGFFTHYLIEALKRAKEPPTVREIYDYLSTHMPDAVAHEKHASQHPQMTPMSDAGDVRIGVVPEAATRGKNE